MNINPDEEPEGLSYGAMATVRQWREDRKGIGRSYPVRREDIEDLVRDEEVYLEMPNCGPRRLNELKDWLSK